MMEVVIIAAGVSLGLIVGTIVLMGIMLSDYMTNKLIKWSLKMTKTMFDTAEGFEEDLEKLEA